MSVSVAICGGGNIAHSLASVISRTQPVMVLTRRPSQWAERLVCDQDGAESKSTFPVEATDDIGKLANADIVFVALPQFAVGETLSNLADCLKSGATVAMVPAPAKSEEYAKRLQEKGLRVVGLQRVPFIARTLEYGCSVRISAPRNCHKLVVSHDGMKDDWNRYCSLWFGGQVNYMKTFVSFAFSNSNPLLHPSRLFVLLRGGRQGAYDACPFFYAEWTDESSELYITSDQEMFKVFKTYAPQSADADYESVLEHYDVASACELTMKIRSIPSFKSIKAPWKLGASGLWEPDYSSRYFTEDIPYGTRQIQHYARMIGVATPTIDMLAESVIPPGFT